MSFYIVSKGRLKAYDFSYLDRVLPIILEPTQIHGKPRATPYSTDARDYYADELMTRKRPKLS